mgnify:CR=1 FL=1
MLKPATTLRATPRLTQFRSELATHGRDAVQQIAALSGIDQRDEGVAHLELERREIGTASLARTLVRFPWMTAQVIAGIYWQAFRLHRLGAAVYPHPARANSAEAPT